MSNIKYRSGNWAVATPVGAIRNESPLLPELNDVLIFHQDFVQLTNSFVRLDYNSINPDLIGPAAYLFNESPREDYGGNCVKWTRSWARIPISYGKAGGTYPYPFPAFDDDTDFRVELRKPVAMEILRDFFLCGTGGVFPSWQQIPIIKGFQIFDLAVNAFIECTKGVRDPSGGDPGTSPSLSQYEAMVSAGTFIDAEDSKVTNWRGGIYMRERYQVVAR